VKRVLAVLALAVVAALAQQWVVEQVDEGRVGGDLQIRQGGGVAYLGYVGPDGQIRLAHKDSTWRFDDLDTSLVVPDFSLAISPAGEPAGAGLDTEYRPILVQHSATGWTAIWSHERLQYYDPLTRVAFTPTGAPVVAYCLNLFTSGGIVVETRVDTTWYPDTAAAYVPSQPNECEVTLYDSDCDSSGNPLILYRYAEGFPEPGMPPWSYAVVRGNRSGGGWTLTTLGGGWNTFVYGYDITASRDGTPCAAYYVSGFLRCEQDAVWPEYVFDAAARVDSSERRHVAFVNTDSTLHYAYKDTRWHFFTVPEVTGVRLCDMVLTDDCQPIIAYTTYDAVSVARGVDVAGQSEERQEPTGHSPQLSATLVRGVLWQKAYGTRQTAYRAELLDATGRTVLEVKAGPNDVSGLAPGIYFVRTQDTEHRTQGAVVRKVIVTR
jgi:hypothetical protein